MVELYLPPSLRHRPAPRGATDPSVAAFQYDLVAALRPRLVVDLGAGSGAAFFVLCRAARDHELDGLLYAVDPFPEDVGKTDAERVQVGVQGLLHSEFRGESYLLPVTDAEAALHFAPGSVDLLRIDARRLGRALHEVLALWLPRLGAPAVVMVEGLAPPGQGDGTRAIEALPGGTFLLGEARDVGVFAPEPLALAEHPSPLLRALSPRETELREDLLRFYAHAGRHLALRQELAGEAQGLSRKGAPA